VEEEKRKEKKKKKKEKKEGREKEKRKARDSGHIAGDIAITRLRVRTRARKLSGSFPDFLRRKSTAIFTEQVRTF